MCRSWDEECEEDAKQTLVGLLDSLLTAFDDRFVDFPSIDDTCSFVCQSSHCPSWRMSNVFADVWCRFSCVAGWFSRFQDCAALETRVCRWKERPSVVRDDENTGSQTTQTSYVVSEHANLDSRLWIISITQFRADWRTHSWVSFCAFSSPRRPWHQRLVEEDATSPWTVINEQLTLCTFTLFSSCSFLKNRWPAQI